MSFKQIEIIIKMGKVKVSCYLYCLEKEQGDYRTKYNCSH